MNSDISIIDLKIIVRSQAKSPLEEISSGKLTW